MSSVRSVIDLGNRGVLIEVECHSSNSLPGIVIVGSANKAVDEAKERVRSAFTTSSLQLPRKRIIINLAPADMPKTDTSFDLAIAAAILQNAGQIPNGCLRESAVLGELGLDGTIRPVRGVVGKLLCARKLGIKTFVMPHANLSQAQLVPGITLIPVQNLRQMYIYLTTRTGIEPQETNQGIIPANICGNISESASISEIIGQEPAKRAVIIAAAGGHNLFLSGPPGTGKSMLAKALPSILPELSHEEALEVTQLHSLASHDYEKPITTRPFRSPHHSASLAAVIGGGHNLRPGEISLAHRGVLFLDEMPEFTRVILEALRQPLEDHTITVARIKDTIEYPANFILVATANPCPCGFYGSSKICTCLPNQIARYQQRISGPILDRIDLHAIVKDIDHQNLLEHATDKSADRNLRCQVIAARAIQAKRYMASNKTNGTMTNSDIKRFARIEPAAKSLLDTAATRLTLSARAYMKIIKVARTIADLDDNVAISVPHITEALQYRRQEERL